MPSTNGHGPKTVVLYARVSGRGQVEEGYSLGGQLRELRAWAEREGYEVLEEVRDGAYKRDTLDRPGINRILDICEERRVDVVMAWQRDRFGEYPYPDVLAGWLREHGTRLRSLDDGGEGEDAEITNAFHDLMARRERRKTARRSRMGKLEAARAGYVVPGPTPAFGYSVAGERKRRTYAVDPERMAVVEQIFRMIGVEGAGVRTAARRLNAEGVPTPPLANKKKNPEFGRDWCRQTIRDVVARDVYKAHAHDEIAALVEQGFMSPDVAARLDPEKLYSIWWYRGKDYDGNEHRVAVPIPDPGISRQWVEAARAVLESNVSPSSAGDREWDLSGGFLFCGGCGHRMQTHAMRDRKHGWLNYYYRCPSHTSTATRKRCPTRVRLHAQRSEDAVWGFVAGLLSSPEQIVAGFDRLIEQERSKLRGDPDEDARELYGKLELLAQRRGAFQDQQATGYMTLQELGVKLTGLEEAREAIERELEACRNRTERICALEEGRDTFAFRGPFWEELEALKEPDGWTKAEGPYGARIPVEEWKSHYQQVSREAVFDALKTFTPEQRRERYGELELKATALSKEELEISGVFDPETVYISETSRRRGSRSRRRL